MKVGERRGRGRTRTSKLLPKDTVPACPLPAQKVPAFQHVLSPLSASIDIHPSTLPVFRAPSRRKRGRFKANKETARTSGTIRWNARPSPVVCDTQTSLHPRRRAAGLPRERRTAWTDAPDATMLGLR
jgi:hypothetical protein